MTGTGQQRGPPGTTENDQFLVHNKPIIQEKNYSSYEISNKKSKYSLKNFLKLFSTPFTNLFGLLLN